jgi:membrane-bound lytic murein transglycosylase D
LPPAEELLSSSTASNAAFPSPPELQPQIKFWQRVYSTWKRNQFILHDDRYLDIVYGVITLPDAVMEDQVSGQKKFVKWHLEMLQNLLRRLEYKTAAGIPMAANEQNLANYIMASSGGNKSLFGASNRLRSQRGMREQFKRGLEISGRYDAAFRSVFREAGLPEDLAYLPHVESSFQNRATSSVGAVGMWQFMPSTARQFGMLNKAVDERLDPVASAKGAARYLRNAYADLDNWPMALTSYNHGLYGMKHARRIFGNNFISIIHNYEGPGFGFASRNFYSEFLAARDIAQNPLRFFPEGVSYEQPLNLDCVRLRKAASALTLADYYSVNIWELNNINWAWNSEVQAGHIQLPPGTIVWLPPGTVTHLSQRDSTGQLKTILADIIVSTSKTIGYEK